MPRHHTRNTAAMHASRRCGARTRAGHACMSPAVGGMNRCRMHGGAPGSGAPLGTATHSSTGTTRRRPTTCADRCETSHDSSRGSCGEGVRHKDRWPLAKHVRVQLKRT
jgi:hypothetical protein